MKTDELVIEMAQRVKWDEEDFVQVRLTYFSDGDSDIRLTQPKTVTDKGLFLSLEQWLELVTVVADLVKNNSAWATARMSEPEIGATAGVGEPARVDNSLHGSQFRQ